MEKVLVIVITADRVLPQCWEAIVKQDYPRFDLLVHVRKPKLAHVDGDQPEAIKAIIKKYINCTDNREAARKIALASDAERFLFVDSDIVIPSGAIAEIVRQPFDVVGGYYKVGGEDRYTCGRWIGDNQFWNLREVEPSLVRVDCVGMGCAMFTRKALAEVVFDHGTDQMARTWLDGQEASLILGECAVLGNLLAEKGFLLHMDGAVVCEHLSA